MAGTSRWYKLKHIVQNPQFRKWITWGGGIFVLLFYFTFLFGMPSISDIQTSFKESSIIYDRDGGQLYTIYGGDENRQYVPYDQVSPRIVQALVAIEDQRFFSNIGFDPIGIVRTAITCGTGGICAGASSLSQQLLKNTLLSEEASVIRRKMQEIFLSLQLNIRYSKEKILELYLNKISFGSNSYGIEQAARRYFGKASKDVTILEAAILGSLPKTPTGFNPYTRRDRLMGYTYYTDTKGDNIEIVKVDKTNSPDVFKTFYDQLAKITFEDKGNSTKACGMTPFRLKSPFNKKSDCINVDKEELMEFLNSIQFDMTITVDGTPQSIVLEYEAGRKDRVLMRMYSDEYINGGEFREAFVQGLDFVFQDPRENIKNPHFVFYIRDYLVEKYGEEFFQQGGWKIYTTLDPKLQNEAQAIIDSYAKTTFANYGINNGALVTLDNQTGDVVAMVGSQDYYNKDIDGEVNIITAMKQPGSSMKPLIYARAFETNYLSTDTPIFDVEMNFGSYKPKNFDGKFLGPMTIRTALDASRNIPAIKMYYMATQHAGDDSATQEYDLVEYLRNMGLTTIEHRASDNLYGPPIALGSAEVRPLDFAAVYSAFSRNGQLVKPNPILKILDGKGNEIVAEKEAPRQIMLPAASYMITNILADNGARPAGWNNFLALAGNRKAAVKTGTSSKKVGENTLPRDLWTIGYTPQYTTAVWTGNTDGKSASARASGMESSALIWKKFMDFAHTNLPKQDFTRPEDVGGNDSFLYIQGKKPEIMKSFNPERIQIDTLCNGIVNERTPKEAIKDAILLDTAFPIEDSRTSWRESVDQWLGSDLGRTYMIEKFGITDNLITVVASPENICERPDESVPQFTSTLTDNIELFSGIYPIEIEFQSDHSMKEAEIYINDVFYRSVDLKGATNSKVKAEFGISRNDGADQMVTITVVDTYGYSSSRNYRIKVLDRDGEKPAINTQNPSTINVRSGQSVNLSGTINDESDVSKIQILVDDIIYGTLQGVRKYNVSLKTPDELGKGRHIVKIEVTDFQKNTTTLVHTVNVE